MGPNSRTRNLRNQLRNLGSTNAFARLNIPRQTVKSKTPFRVTYGVEAIIPVEIGEPSPRILLGTEDVMADRNLIDKVQSEAHLTDECQIQQRNHQKALQSRRPGPATEQYRATNAERRQVNPELGRTLSRDHGPRQRGV
ncbi:hypothetical protein PIB30_009426 [Stylosanthes scabra]|uniref:Uncharacterized protein n=1 Tax=Stylosanthes scabra TaxID=79078 RepID=A0ABU6W5V1_9FABA|nr:hypothetical protein [Stylosanthes scabra]